LKAERQEKFSRLFPHADAVEQAVVNELSGLGEGKQSEESECPFPQKWRSGASIVGKLHNSQAGSRASTEMTMIGSFALWYLTYRALTHFSTLLKYALDQRIWMKICLRGVEGGFETSRFSDLA
jgi:hypothetical protein